MKNIAIILVITIMTLTNTTSLFAQNAGGTLFPTTSVYAGDLTTEKFQEKLAVIDAEILKLETKKEAELTSLEKSYKANMPKAPKQKKEATKKAPVKKAEYSLIEDLSPTTEAIDTTAKVEAPTDNYAEIKADYDAKYENSKNVIVAKYDALIEKLNEQKVTLTEAMVNSKGNYIASTTSAQKAAYLYASIKYADNIGNNTTTTSAPGNGQTVMLYVHNETTNCTITITSAPFNGITLTPGQKSLVAFPVAVGNYSLAYTEYRNGTSIAVPRTMFIPITLGGGTDINIPGK